MQNGKRKRGDIMTIMQRDFLDNLAKLFKAYKVISVCAVNDKIYIDFENERSMELMKWNGDEEIFRDVMTKADYKPTETELDV